MSQSMGVSRQFEKFQAGTQRPASLRSRSALSVFSQVKSGSERPKWPKDFDLTGDGEEECWIELDTLAGTYEFYIGAQKSGTTSLYNYLIQHPYILPAFKKEIHFFDDHFKKGDKWYRSFFPL
ncbi:MAG: hypothetical protein R6X33_06325, partial [Candidatus Brocadiia bacterium]